MDWEVRVQFFSFACGNSVPPAPFVKVVIFSVVYVFDGFVKSDVVVTVCVFFPGSSALFHFFLHIHFCAGTHCSCYEALPLNLRSSIVIPPAFFFWQGFLCLFGSYDFIWIWKLISSSVKNVLGILSEIVLNSYPLCFCSCSGIYTRVKLRALRVLDVHRMSPSCGSCP